MFFAGALVAGGHFQDAVNIDLEGHFDLWHTPRGGRNSRQEKFTEGFIIPGHGPFPLQNMNFHRSLTIGSGGENLRSTGGDSGIAIDNFGKDFAEGFNAEGKGGDIK